MAKKRSIRTRARERQRERERCLENTRERILRQEQSIAHLAADGRSTVLAEKRLVAMRRALDALLERRRSRAEGRDSAPLTTLPDQLGPAERMGQPGAETP
jgi:hypothetical protein